ncbi:MAG TPA: AMP-dependent synthetase/ligase [Anaeromyxobacteraceae bacterium]|nr:AMP-dependent synthetase/ligase [Anaeromyxobacteraceae bacterium]
MRAEAQLVQGVPEARTLFHLLEWRASRSGERPAMRYKADGRWVDVSWRETAARARAIADGLASLGIARGDRVAILADSSVGWAEADLGIVGAGAVTVTIFPTSPAEDCRFFLADSGARLVFCDSDAQIEKIRAVRDALPALEGIVRLRGPPADAFERTLEALVRDGEAFGRDRPRAHEERLAALGPDDPASIIYTSGTTGRAKGVVSTHGNWMYVAAGLAQMNHVTEDDVVLLFLPLAHSFAKALGAAWLVIGSTTAFVESVEKLVENAAEVRPTVMPAVPRIFEKAFHAVVAKGLAKTGLDGKLFRMALEELDRITEAHARGERHGGFRLAVARRVVFPKVGKLLRDRFGGRIRLFASGAAPLSPRVGHFFQELGIVIAEGYGLTETSAPVTANRPGAIRIGTVGTPLPGTEVRLAPDGEILVKGPGVMKGYWNADAATAEVIRDGWFHTGDIGTLDDHGYLTITDRKKDLIVTSGGKNVAPQNLENELKADPIVSQVLVHGDRRPYLVALVTLDLEQARRFAEANGIEETRPEALAADVRIRERVQRVIDAMNVKQPGYSTIRKFAILPEDFTVEGGQLTPTLKVKRKACVERHRRLLDGMYDVGQRF